MNESLDLNDYSLSENLLGEEYVFLGEAQWEYRTNLLLSTKLPPMYKNYYFYLELETWDNYEHDKKAEFNFCDSNWTGWYVFTNEKKTGISKESWGKYSISTKKKTTGTLLITLSQKEAEEIAQKGLRIEGYGLTLKTLRVYSDKVADDPSDSLEKQYEKKKPKIEKDLSYYKDFVGFKLPIINITTKDSQDILKKEYYKSIIDIANCDEAYKLDGIPGEVKVRGNSTSWGEEKPYRIKFSKKQKMLGLNNDSKYKSWVLLKTGWAVAMDYLGFNLAHEIYKTSKFKYYASDATYVHVIINGYYKGLYLLCEQNQINKGRVDVYENEEKDTGTNIGYMIELDNYAWDDKNPAWNIKDENVEEKNKLGFPVGSGFRLINGKWEYRQGLEDYHFTLDYKQRNENGEKVHVPLTDINGVTRQIESDDFTLKNDVYSDEQVVFIQKYMKGVWDICYFAIEKGKYYKFDDDYNLIPAEDFTTAKEACDAVIDLESLCNEMILEELVRDNDVGAGSLYMAIDFHNKKPDEKYYKLTFECPWDFNWAYSPIENDLDGGAYWNGKLQYFAGAWQSPEVNTDEYDRSHGWFILFNNADWFREMLRERWEKIDPQNLKETVLKVREDLVIPLKEGRVSESNTDFVLKRIDYIDSNLWE